MAITKERLAAAINVIDDAAADWERCAQAAQAEGDADGQRMYAENAAESERFAVALETFAATPHAEKVRRNITARMAVLDRRAMSHRLRQTAKKFKGQPQGLRAMMKLFGWSDEDADSAYKSMRKDRRFQDSLTAGAGRPASAGTAAALATTPHAARLARQQVRTGTASTGTPAGASASPEQVFADLLAE